MARVVATLGGDALAVYPGGGPFGDLLERTLAGLGVPQRRVPIAGDTREKLHRRPGRLRVQYRFVLPGPELSAVEQQACLDAIAALDPRPSWLVLSGSFPRGVAPMFFDQVVALAQRIGARLVLDCSGEALRHAGQRGAIHLLKPSLSELATLAGGKVEGVAAQEAALRELIGRGVAEVIVLSLGGEGAVLASKEGIERFAPLDVPVCSAVGADSMAGAMVLALSRWAEPAGGGALRHRRRLGDPHAPGHRAVPGGGCRAAVPGERVDNSRSDCPPRTGSSKGNAFGSFPPCPWIGAVALLPPAVGLRHGTSP